MMKKNTTSKATDLSDAMPLDATDILPPLQEISEEELFDINGGTGWYVVDVATALVGLPAPKNVPHPSK